MDDGSAGGGSLKAGALPKEAQALAARLLPGATVLAHAPFDLGDDLKFAAGHAFLTSDQVVVLRGEAVTKTDLSALTEASIEEGLGVDRLKLIAGDELLATLRYSRTHRTAMTRLQRKLARRLPGKDGKIEERPGWLENVERRAEANAVCPKCGNAIPSYAEGACPRCLQQRKILLRLLDVAKPYRRQINIALALTICHSVLMGAGPMFLQKHLIDDALLAEGLSISQRFRSLAVWGGGFVLMIVVTELLGGLRMGILSTVGTSVARDLRHLVYAHLHSLSLRFFNKRRTGSLITRVTNDTDRLWDFIVFGSVNLFRDVLMMFVMAGTMFWLNWRLACVALAPVPVVAVMSYLRGRKMHASWARVWNYWSRITAVVGDALPGVRVIKAFASEGREIGRFDRRSDEYTQREQETNRLWWTLQPLVSALMRVGGIAVLIVGGWLHISGRGTTVGDLLAFYGAVWQFYGPVMELVNSNRMVTRAATSASRVFEVLDTPPDIFDRQGAHKPAEIKGKIEFRNVSYSYEGAAPALRDISLTIQPGEMIGLAGPSGAGKTTFVNMIPRFYDVTDGAVFIDDVDVRDYDVGALRRHIGMVLQEPYLFQGTIADNIRYGRPDATDAQVIEAARAANAHDFIVGFPDGYDTTVGERGQSLSGGERQRVSIARAILHDPRILILDEATSSVDAETEKQIQQALDRLVEGRTTIAIAHRLSTLTAADRLIVLEKGKLAEQGTHDELADKPEGVYAKLVRTQKELGSLMAVAG